MFSESVYLDAVSPDGAVAFVTRLARHPDGGVAWLWLHVFHGSGDVAFVRDDLPCAGGPTPADRPYRLAAGGVEASFERHGPAGPPAAATVHVRVPGATLDATFTADGAAGSNLPGRTETLGCVDATVTTEHGPFTLRARGQFHEQHQDTPRFTVPFTYGTLRGDDLGLVFLIGPRRSGGFVRRGQRVDLAREATIDPVGPARTLRLALEDGAELVLDVARTHHYLLPIDGTDRESSIVRAVAGDDHLSGCINDWEPA